jgi:hypothetical protein
MRLRRLSLTAFAACLVAAAIVLCAAPLTTAVAAVDAFIHFMPTSLIGVAPGDAVGLNFTSVANRAVVAELNFLDRNGRLLKTSGPTRVSPGQSLSLNFAHREAPAGHPPSERFRIRVIIAVIPTDQVGPPLEPSHMQGSLEVFNEVTGQSAFGLLLPCVKVQATGGGGGAGLGR